MKKEKMIDTWLKTPIRTGDSFRVKGTEHKYTSLGAHGDSHTCYVDGNHEKRVSIKTNNTNIYKIADDFNGINPFLEKTIQFLAFSIESILGIIDNNREKDYVRFNWNPYFLINGEKVHYQRGFVWTLKQKKALITSIYKNLEIGRIVVVRNSYEKQQEMIKMGHTDFAMVDIVDGKQRLSTIVDFVNDEFCDENGFYYSDLSRSAKSKFENYQGLLYGEMHEGCTYEQICDAFLNNAVSGTPISKSHIDFIIKTKAELLEK